MLPAPVVERVGRLLVVRDDLLPGGTKMRAILPLIESRPEQEFVYASPAYEECREAPPFPSSPWYDAKGWGPACARASEGALFWNVGG